MSSLREFWLAAQPHLPETNLARWASIFFTLCVLTLLISLSASQAFLLLAGVCILAHAWRSKSEFKFPPIKMPLAIFCGWSVVSLLFAENPAAGGFALRKMVLFAILALAVNTVASLKHLEFLLQGLFVEAAIAGLRGTVQFVEQYRHVRAAYPGQVYFYMTLDRITGFMGHWMNFSGQQMLVFTALAALLLFARGSGRNSSRASRIPFAGAAGLMVFAVVGLSIFLSFTRGVWLGCLVAGLYLLAIRLPRGLWALPVLVVAGYFVSPHMMRERINLALHPSRDPALAVRFEMWHAGLQMMKHHPLVGVGPNNIFETYPLYLPPGKTPIIGYHDHLHNNFIQLGAERGLPCLAAWIWMMGAFGWHFVRIRRRLRGRSQATWIVDAALAGWIAFLVEGCFEFNFGTSPVLMVFLFVASTPFVVEDLERNVSRYAGLEGARSK